MAVPKNRIKYQSSDQYQRGTRFPWGREDHQKAAPLRGAASTRLRFRPLAERVTAELSTSQICIRERHKRARKSYKASPKVAGKPNAPQLSQSPDYHMMFETA